MNLLQKIARKTIKVSFNLSVKTIEAFSDMSAYQSQVDELRNMDDGTIGREIARCLDDHDLTLVPKFESHDLKHVLLNYKMTPEDEIRMQAFMLGNGNYTLPTFVIFTFGAILLPDLWGTFRKDFLRGRKTTSIAQWTIENHADRNLAELQSELTIETSRKKLLTMQRIIKLGAISAIIGGVFGMIFCLPFLFSDRLEDLVGAGFPFVGGAILAVGGLIALAKNQANSNIEKESVQKI